MNMEDLHEKINMQPFCSMNQNVYELLLDDIINLRLNPGYKLNELQLAKDVGISRSPIKMAIDRLCKEGLVESSPGKVSRVAALELKDCMQLYEIRKGIEGEAAFLAAKRISKEKLLRMKKLIQNSEQACGVSCSVNIDCELHQIIIDATNNDYIMEAYERIKNRIRRYRYYMVNSVIDKNEITGKQLRCHLAIFHALENGFSSTARDEVIQDIDTMQIIAKYVK